MLESSCPKNSILPTAICIHGQQIILIPKGYSFWIYSPKS